ncbi:MAG: DUF4271 domain-containing protein [Bacteroidaceae bacterium]|nr:DUF4271 domain-containing protein [Bacteroidaceae bacterium]
MYQTVADSTIVSLPVTADSLTIDSLKPAKEAAATDTLTSSLPALSVHTSPKEPATPATTKAYEVAHTEPLPIDSLIAPLDSSLCVHPDTASNVQLNTISLFGNSEDNLQTWGAEQTTYCATGIAGEPLPYQFRTDNYVTGLLLLSFFLIVGVIAASWRFLSDNIKDFFYLRQSKNLFTDRHDTELRGHIFLILQSCFLLGILYTNYVQECQNDLFIQTTPHKILGLAIGTCSLFVVGKVLLYKFVNNVFFSYNQSALWYNIYYLSVLALGFGLLPLTLLVVYFDLDYSTLQFLFVCILATVKILLFYKCFQIFFNYKFGSVHLFLYFCALEILPLFVFWKILVQASGFLEL